MRKQSTGIFALVLVGGYFAWRNRFQIQRYFQSLGISTPLSTNSIGDTVKSAAAKVTGSAEHTINSLDHQSRKAV